MSYFAWVKQPFRMKLVPQIIHDEKMHAYKKLEVVAKHPYQGETFEVLMAWYPAPSQPPEKK